MTNKWYVITGGPSVGKTSLLGELEKLGYKTVPEAARLVIDRGIAKGLTIQDIRKDEQKFQESIAALKKEIEAKHDQNTLTFFDRGMHDTLAYMRLGGYPMADWIHELAAKASYQKVFVLEPLPIYESDYARTETKEERLKLNELLASEYRDAGMEVISVPVMPIVERAKFILNHIKDEVEA